MKVPLRSTKKYLRSLRQEHKKDLLALLRPLHSLDLDVLAGGDSLDTPGSYKVIDLMVIGSQASFLCFTQIVTQFYGLSNLEFSLLEEVLHYLQ